MSRIVALSADLMDRSKIAAAYPDAKLVRSASALVETATDAELVIVDLHRAGAVELLGDLVAVAGRVVAYGSHVDTDVLDAARAAGCTEVLPRSRFFATLGR